MTLCRLSRITSYNVCYTKLLRYLVLLADEEYFGNIVSSSLTENAFSVALYTDDGNPVHTNVSQDLTAGVYEFLKNSVVWQVNKEYNMLFVRSDVRNANWSLISMQKLDILFSDIDRFRP